MAHGFALWAGPLATVVASVTAAGVAATYGYFQYQLGRAQKAIAESQRDIAYDKLKFDLFAKRYEVYATAKKLIEHICSDAHPEDIDDSNVLEWRNKLAESGFFFSGQTKELLDLVAHLTERYLLAHVQHSRLR